MENRLSRKTKLFYGVAGIGDSALYSMMGMFALFFFTTVAGINPAAAGTIIAVGTVWDVVSGSVAGYISDRTHTRMGRRKPFVMAAAFPPALFSVLAMIMMFRYPITRAKHSEIVGKLNNKEESEDSR